MSQQQYEKGFASGRLRGVTDQIHADRVAAFGAIRRAAEVAREEDRRVIEYREIYHDPIISAASEVVASGIRFAIRVAIESRKL